MEVMNWLNPCLFAAGIVFVAAAESFGKKTAADGSRASAAIRWITAALFLLAVAVRVYRFGSLPGGMNQDGAMAAVDARALADYGTDRFGTRLPAHFTAWGYGQMSVLMSYLMIPWLKLFGLSPLTARLPNLLVSLAGIVCLWDLTRRRYGAVTAAWVLGFAAICPWQLLQSRWALDCNLYPHFVLFGTYFLCLGAEKKRRFYWIGMLFFGLAVYAYGVAAYTLPLLLVGCCAWLLARKKLRWGEAVGCAAVFLLVSAPFWAVMVINAFGLETVETPLFTLQYFPKSYRSGDILFFSAKPLEQLGKNAQALLRLLLQQGEDLPWNEISGFGTTFVFTLPFAVTGFMRALRGRRESFDALLLIWFGAALFGGLVTSEVNVNRANLLFYPVLLFTALGLDEVCRRVRFSSAVAAAILAGVFALFCRTGVTTWAARMRDAFLEDFGTALVSVRDTDAKRIYVTADSQYTGAAHVSEILTLFWHDVDARYFQGETSEGEIPYREKYVYGRVCDLTVDPDEDAVWVIRGTDEVYFDEEDFSVTPYGRFAVAVPRGAEDP